MTEPKAVLRHPERLWLKLSCATLSLAFSSCFLKKVETQDSMTESEFVQLHANCGPNRNFLFAHVEPSIRGRSEKDWGCWYAGSSNQVFATPKQEELLSIFGASKPVSKNFVNLNTLTKRLADIDTQRSAILWMGVGVALVGCGVATAGTLGVALAGCALLGSTPALYDIFGGDPSQGAGEAWRKMADMKPDEITKLECNAVKTISEQIRFIDLGALPQNEGASRVTCPSAKSVLTKTISISGQQAGAHEVKNIKPATNSESKR
ncbi:MAG: hypothetical protein EBR09_10655 [Proteobacteria bacterium]|nr:hypothetical protein [Pseudomonadota bacterium]